MHLKGRVRKSLKFSFWDGFFASCMAGMVNDYITPYALVLKASTRQIGALNAVPFLASSLVQLKAAELVERFKSHIKTIVVFVLLHALMLLPIIFIPYLFKNQAVLFLIILFTLYTAFNSLTGPVAASLIAEYIPSNMRGRYFGWRNKVLTVVLIISSLTAGFILHYFKKDVLKGFMIILSIAFVSRLISGYFITRLYELPFRQDKAFYFTFLDFVKNIRKSNFAKFVLFFSGMQFCVNVASPFFAVFMLRDLKFNYITYTILVTAVTVAQIFTLERWGRCADRVGNVRVLKFTSLIIASLPLWWIICHHPFYLIFAQLLSGIAWAGFNLSAGNFIYDAVMPQKRVRCFAYFSVFVGGGVFLGGILGGHLANILPNVFGYKLFTLFFISAILRFLVALSLSCKIKEVRPVEKISGQEMFLNIIGIKPIYK